MSLCLDITFSRFQLFQFQIGPGNNYPSYHKHDKTVNGRRNGHGGIFQQGGKDLQYPESDLNDNFHGINYSSIWTNSLCMLYLAIHLLFHIEKILIFSNKKE